MQNAAIKRILKDVLRRFVRSVNGRDGLELPNAQEDGLYVMRGVELNPETLLPPSKLCCERAFAEELRIHLPASAVLASLSSSEPIDVALVGVEVVLIAKEGAGDGGGAPSVNGASALHDEGLLSSAAAMWRSVAGADEARSPSAKLGATLGGVNLTLTDACFTLRGRAGCFRLSCASATAVNAPEELASAEGSEWICKKVQLGAVILTSKPTNGPTLNVLSSPACSLIARLPKYWGDEASVTPFNVQLDLGRCTAEMDSTNLALLLAFASGGVASFPVAPPPPVSAAAPSRRPPPTMPSVGVGIAAAPVRFFQRIAGAVGAKRPRDQDVKADEERSRQRPRDNASVDLGGSSAAKVAVDVIDLTD